MTIEHVDIPDGEIHEPKGSSTALSGQVLSSNGDSTTSFVTLTVSRITDAEMPAIDDITSDPPTVNELGDKINELLAALRAQGYLGV